MRPDQIIIAPIVTEKSSAERELGKYTFVVDKRANKIQVEEAIKSLFKVNPIACNVVNVKGKPKRLRQAAGKTSSWKKAVVTLKEGETISVFEGA
ncbi:50S ribosomal protein L23 [Spirochaeta lutea]|uniref:Large ribosomal subunit protein uL23 n=1 Tax=Spirochaeta lutea TaxID=1480694 RepID=A0A098QTF7_9SPIO|nr:50S ribosomal protein L23 [Spirochaeta lutea]KGE70688.1 50S ribosomal protein L23 [Spirochaeta lutea]